ncbi:hypothetical protein D3C80_1132330 [compost metagenome]
MQEWRKVGLGLPALGHAIAEQYVHFAHEGAKAAHMVLVELSHMGTAPGQDGHQVTALENQQRFTHRATADVQCLGYLLLLNAFGRLELPANDALGKVMGNLLGEAVRRLERHGFPLKSATCASAPV